MKTSELLETTLDWAVAKCEQGDFMDRTWWSDFGGESCYSTDWAQGGPIIERGEIALEPMTHDKFGDGWLATRIEGPAVCMEFGPTMLIAAMRCYVVSQLGDEIEIPEEAK